MDPQPQDRAEGFFLLGGWLLLAPLALFSMEITEPWAQGRAAWQILAPCAAITWITPLILLAHACLRRRP